MALAPAVRKALAAVPLTEADKATSALALRCALAIDRDEVELAKAAPVLLAVLDALGMTPKARKALVREAADGPPSPLDELRARRAARAAG